MTNKKIWLGMLVMVLAFGMTVLGCEEYSIGQIKITNGSQFKIKQVVFKQDSSVVKSDPAGIEPGQSKTYEFDDFDGTVTITVTVNLEDVVLEKAGGVSGISAYVAIDHNKWELVLSGTTKDTLRLDAL